MTHRDLPAPPPAWPETLTPENDDRGFIFAASGQKYTNLASAAAKTVRDSNPGIAIDLYTDCDTEDGIFDQIHQLQKSWFRPKFEALQRTRFGRCIYLDCDIAVVGDMSDAFWTLLKFDLAAAHVQNRNLTFANRVWRSRVPNAFPQVNTGVFGMRTSTKTRAFFADVHHAISENNLPMDQFVVRELLWASDLRLGILPEEYNWRKTEKLYVSNWSVPAPRVLHSQKFVKKMKGLTPPSPKEVYGRGLMWWIRNQIKGDRQLSNDSDRKGPLLRFFK